MIVTRQDIMNEADDWLGVRWRHQGRTRINGIDCVGLVVLTGGALGLIGDFKDTQQYARTPSLGSLAQPFDDNMTRKPLDLRQKGDVVLMRDDVYPCHVGIITESIGLEGMIHAHALSRKVVKHPLDDQWVDKMTHCYAFRGVE